MKNAVVLIGSLALLAGCWFFGGWMLMIGFSILHVWSASIPVMGYHTSLLLAGLFMLTGLVNAFAAEFIKGATDS